MLYMILGQIIHEERQHEIERNLERRRLLEHLRKPVGRPAVVASVPCPPVRQERAGAAS